MHGFGVLKLPNGKSLAGTWIDDKLHGSSTISNSLGVTLESIQWENGKQVQRNINESDSELYNVALVAASIYSIFVMNDFILAGTFYGLQLSNSF